jgi:hypothetical protein
MPTLNALESFLTKMVDDGTKDVAKFQKDLATNPGHAFQWADTVMNRVAKMEVAQSYLAWIAGYKEGKTPAKTDDELVQTVMADATKNALRMAQYNSQSTSTGSNFMERARLAAFAKIVEDAGMMW